MTIRNSISLLSVILATWLLLPAAHASNDQTENRDVNNSATPFLLDYQHQNLRNGTLTDLATLKGKPVVMMFFEPSCSWCLKQAKVLKQLEQQCQSSFTPVALGVNGERKRLKKTLFKLRFPYPAYRASQRLLGEMGGIPATPIMLITDNNGFFKKYYRGLTDKETLQPLLCS